MRARGDQIACKWAGTARNGRGGEARWGARERGVGGVGVGVEMGCTVAGRGLWVTDAPCRLASEKV